jgi:hypothetical protein
MPTTRCQVLPSVAVPGDCTFSARLSADAVFVHLTNGNDERIKSEVVVRRNSTSGQRGLVVAKDRIGRQGSRSRPDVIDTISGQTIRLAARFAQINRAHATLQNPSTACRRGSGVLDHAIQGRGDYSSRLSGNPDGVSPSAHHPGSLAT